MTVDSRSRKPDSVLRTAFRGGRRHDLAEEDLVALILGRNPRLQTPGIPRGRGRRLRPRRPRVWRGASPGPDPSVRLDAVLVLVERLRARAVAAGPEISTPEEVAALAADIRSARREHVLGFYLNTRNRLLARETISVGSLNASIVHPREVFEPALRLGAASLVVVHNHPSGITDPSPDDLAVTRRLRDAGELLGVALLDHVIVGGDAFTSLKDANAL